MKRKWIWIIIIAILAVAVALTFVFVGLFSNKETTAIAKSVNQVVTTGYLSKDSEDMQKIDVYLDGIAGLPDATDADKNYVQNSKNLIDGYQILANFYQKEILFVDFTNELKQNQGSIKKSLSNAQKEVDNLVERIDSINESANGNAEIIKQGWEESKKMLENFLNENKNAFDKLALVYTKSCKSVYYNNGLTQKVLDTASTLNDLATKSSATNLMDVSTKYTKNFLDMIKYYLDISSPDVLPRIVGFENLSEDEKKPMLVLVEDYLKVEKEAGNE